MALYFVKFWYFQRSPAIRFTGAVDILKKEMANNSLYL